MKHLFIKHNIVKKICVVILSSTISTSCSKLVEVEPPITSTTGSSVYNLDATAISVVTGIYTLLSQNSFATGPYSVSLQCGLSSDELTLFSGIPANDSKTLLFKNALFAIPGVVTPATENWGGIYNFIFTCNSAIEGIEASTSLSETVKNQLLGEVKFLRAFCHFYLLNIFGEVPIVTTTDYTINKSLHSATSNEIFDQIIADLISAKSFLSSEFLDGSLLKKTSEKIRPTSWAANALLARVYLYKGDYINAETEANNVINSTLFSLTSLENTFLKNNSEALWQLQPVNAGWNTEDARIFVLNNSLSSSKPVHLSNYLTKEFDSTDKRKTHWIKSFTDASGTYQFANKYKAAVNGASVTEYLTVIRMAELYLIRSEARLALNKIADAKSDLNIIRQRAGLSDVTTNEKTALSEAILQERRLEFFTEWGHRWFDLKRTGKIDSVMKIATPLKSNGGEWKSFQKLYPIPADQVLINPNLQQNSGY